MVFDYHYALGLSRLSLFEKPEPNQINELCLPGFLRPQYCARPCKKKEQL